VAHVIFSEICIGLPCSIAMGCERMICTLRWSVVSWMRNNWSKIILSCWLIYSGWHNLFKKLGYNLCHSHNKYELTI
jgi:hypothetical protein